MEELISSKDPYSHERMGPLTFGVTMVTVGRPELFTGVVEIVWRTPRL
jgi:hypothetical protein